MPLPRSALTLSLGGAQDGSVGGSGPLQSGWVSARGSALIAGTPHFTADAPSAWGIVGNAEARLFGTTLPGIEGAHRFYRLGLSVGGFYVSEAHNVYWVEGGAFVAEQGSLLGSATIRPRISALGTHHLNQTTTLLYGAGYTYNFGRGLPLPFLGVDWRFAPAWRLDVLLPVNARVAYRAAQNVWLGAGAGVTGEVFGYQPLGTTTADEAGLLHLTWLRVGIFGRYALTTSSYVRLDVGVEGTRVDTGSISRTGGGYLQLAFGLGSAGPSVYDPSQLRP